MHNHPSGDPTPSRADIAMTQAIVEVAKPLGISVHDHFDRREARPRQLQGPEVDLATSALEQSELIADIAVPTLLTRSKLPFLTSELAVLE